MRTRTLMIAGLFAAVAAFSAFGGNGVPIGREVARDGQVTGVSGSLEHRDNEWFIDTAGGELQLMLGRFGYEKDLPFAGGASAEVHGFSIPEYLAPMTVTTGDETVEFWHEARYPLWAGSGERRNAVDGPRAERAEDARGLALDRTPLGQREDAPRVQMRTREPGEVEEPAPERARGRRLPPRDGRR